ncbi:MAG: aminopeptidase P family protein [Saprospiraceae bacterium]|nr:aminopeptidase P family protein [Saprospiraceae bacterium]
MFSAATYQKRRQNLARQMGDGLILLPGNIDAPMNYKANPYAFRQDSTFLYYCGLDMPGLVLLIDAGTGETTLFGHELTMEDIIWVGPHASLKSQAAGAGIENVLEPDQLEAAVRKGNVHFLPPYRGDNLLRLAGWLGKSVDGLAKEASVPLIQAVVAQRSIKSAEEIEQMIWAVNLSGRMHVAVMRDAEEGMLESDLSGIVTGMCEMEQVVPAYGIILTTDGQILHNHYHGNELQSGQLVLGDFGAESPMHYAGDITRTFPVDRHFTQQQREIYELVLKAETGAIAQCAPGITYKEVHLSAARTIVDGLKAIGLMKGDVDEAVAAGAHALFFPHGLGHMIGLDVHDMEDLGENYVGYGDGVARSDQFGLAYLRLARALQPGFVLTVEPGIYFIPELMDQWQTSNKHASFINYNQLKSYRDFGGIRIEDNVLITEDGRVILGDPIPKTIAEIEALRYVI